jgi:hypothetical protein
MTSKALITITRGGIVVGTEEYDDMETASYALVIAAKGYEQRGFLARPFNNWQRIVLQTRTGEQVKLELTEVNE